MILRENQIFVLSKLNAGTRFIGLIYTTIWEVYYVTITANKQNKRSDSIYMCLSFCTLITGIIKYIFISIAALILGLYTAYLYSSKTFSIKNLNQTLQQ